MDDLKQRQLPAWMVSDDEQPSALQKEEHKKKGVKRAVTIQPQLEKAQERTPKRKRATTPKTAQKRRAPAIDYEALANRGTSPKDEGEKESKRRKVSRKRRILVYEQTFDTQGQLEYFCDGSTNLLVEPTPTYNSYDDYVCPPSSFSSISNSTSDAPDSSSESLPPPVDISKKETKLHEPKDEKETKAYTRSPKPKSVSFQSDVNKISKEEPPPSPTKRGSKPNSTHTMEMLRILCKDTKPNPDLPSLLCAFTLPQLKQMMEPRPLNKEGVIEALVDAISRIVDAKTKFFTSDQLIEYHIRAKKRALLKEETRKERREKRKQLVESKLLKKAYQQKIIESNSASLTDSPKKVSQERSTNKSAVATRNNEHFRPLTLEI